MAFRLGKAISGNIPAYWLTLTITIVVYQLRGKIPAFVITLSTRCWEHRLCSYERFPARMLAHFNRYMQHELFVGKFPCAPLLRQSVVGATRL